MKQPLGWALAGLTLAGAPPAVAAPLLRTTHKPVEPFAQCFAQSQDRASRPWSYVPKSGGGTFSNAGASGVRRPYFLELSDRGTTRQIRLDADAASPDLVRAVDGCI